MRGAGRKAIAIGVLLAPQMLAGQSPSHAGQQPGGQPQAVPAQTPGASSLQPGVSPSGRTPREDEELRADILVARKQYADAVPIYHKLAKQEPRNAVLLNKLGIAYHQQTLLDQAKRHYERAFKADPTYATAMNNIGTVHYQRKNYRKAVQAYRRALEIRADMPSVHSNLGYAYFGQKRYEEALQALQRALELDPQVFERSHHTGSLLQDRSVADRGLFHFFLAKSFATTGNAERCAHYLRRARDEGYNGLAAARTDPAFAGVLDDRGVREVLQLPPTPEEKTPAPPPAPAGGS